MTERNFLDDYEEQEEQGFVVDTATKADWCIKKIAEHEAEYERLAEIAEAEIKDIEMRQAKALERKEAKVNGLKALLIPFFNSVEHKETKTQESFKLLHGTLVMKKPTVKLVKPEDDVLAEYLKKAAPEYVTTVEVTKCAWGDFKKNLSVIDGEVINTETGEKVDCVSTEETAADFSIKF